MGASRRHLSRIPAKRPSLDERVKLSSSPSTKVGAMACGSLSVKRSKAFKKDLIPLLLTKTRYNRSQNMEMFASCGMEAPRLGSFCCVEHPRRTPEDLCVSQKRFTNNAQARNWIQNKTRRMPIHVVTNHQALLFLTFRRCACCRVRTNLVTHSARSFHSRAMHHGDVFFGKVLVPRFVRQRKIREKKQGTRLDRSRRLLVTMGLRMFGGTKNSGNDSCGAEVSMERSKGCD